MGYPMTGTQYFPQQGYGMGYPPAGYPGMGQQQPYWPTQSAPASTGGTDPNAILGAVIQPLMGLVMSLLTGAPADEQTCPVPVEDPTQDPGTADPGASDTTLGPDSETSDYLEVLNDKSNSRDLKALEKKYGEGKGKGDGKLTADEVHNILKAIEKGKKGTEDVSEDLKAALTWLDQDETGQTVMINLSNEFDEKGNAAINIKKGFDESEFGEVDVDDLEDEEIGPSDAYDALTYLKDNQDFADKIKGEDDQLTKAEIETALKSDKYNVEEKAVLRMLRSTYDDMDKEVFTNLIGEDGTDNGLGISESNLTTVLSDNRTKLETLN